jgi:hypothetical protein
MSNRTKLGLNILEAALLLGVLGDALLRETPWGLNVFLWAGALAAAMLALHARWGRTSWRADGGWLLLPVAFFAAAFAWRDSATLKWLDGLALFVAFALLAWRARGRKIRLGGLADYASGLGHAALDAMFASLPLIISDVQWATIPRHGVMRHAWAAARGLVIAVPLLFVFGALFMAADAVFAGIMRQTFQLDSGSLFSHFFLMLLFAWMTGGFLRGMTLTAEPTAAVSEPVPAAYTSITTYDGERHGAAATGATHTGEPEKHKQPPGSVVVEGGAVAAGGENVESGESVDGGEQASGEGDAGGQAKNAEAAREQASGARVVAGESTAREFSLGAVEVGVVLGLLNVLFACFVIVQFRYFFGGAARVMSVTELTYSEYARRGFFELTWVAGLVLPLLLGAHALLKKNDSAAGRIFRPLAGAQIALLFVIMASAVARMRLYQSEYGLTELRVYTTAFMLWLGLVFVWFVWTVLVQNARQRFACGALVAAFVTVGLLHLVNLDAYIVRANVAHARAGRSFDAAYAASLSADAVPALVSALPSLGREERCQVERGLTENWIPTARDLHEDWRAWNFSRWRARRVVAAHRNASGEATCPPPASSVPADTATSAPPPPPAPLASGATTASVPVAVTNTTATTTTANAATNAVETKAMITEGKDVKAGAANSANAGASDSVKAGASNSGKTGASNAARSVARRGGGKTKRHDRARPAERAKAR